MLVRKRISPDDWTPVGIAQLEANALDVVRSTDNRSVIAGPGSGKTELLAQRACFLLQSGASPPPRRILAISYKRDAAANLAARVKARCHPDLSHRLDSLTFDAFAKGLVDRFGQTLPERWRPRPNYEIANATFAVVQNTLELLDPPPSAGSKRDIIALGVKTFERNHLVARPLSVESPAKPTIAEWTTAAFWNNWLHEGPYSVLTFSMIGRLAELLVRTNPMVREALRLTYSHLFMDEFQDITQVQYDLAKTIFCGSQTVVTAVGDHKQQIMRWAMAMADPFTPFEKDFGATRTPLYNNYRSSPDLVRIQDILAKALDRKSGTPVSKASGTISGDSCEVWDFQTAQQEAKRIAEFVAAEIKKYDLMPRDFAILVRVKAAEYFKVLEPALAATGLTLRNESAQIGKVALQELLAEPLSETVITLLRLSTSERAGHWWTECVDALCTLRGLAFDDDGQRQKLAKALETFAQSFSASFPKPPANQAEAKIIVQKIMDFAGVNELRATSIAYRQGDWFDEVKQAVTTHLLHSSTGASSWISSLDVYEGIHAVPLMTIHKSKGLEYHTVIFVGLDDGAWFAFKQQSQEETAGFFVAFTRAKQRVVFTYCGTGGTRTQIAPLYALLKSAGVKTLSKA